MFAMSGRRFVAVESGQGGSELHLGVLAAEADGFLNEGITIGAGGRILPVVVSPHGHSGRTSPGDLLVAGNEIAVVELGERVGGVCLGALLQVSEQVFRSACVTLGVDGGAAKSFHADE